MTINNHHSPGVLSENRLAGQQSLYLRQHSRNPIDWYPWGDEAIARAASENKPIFLSIGYSACHWCHVMEKEVFVKDDVADILNNNYICIKVDREERPDLDAVYMEAVQAITGGGGWPLSVFLTSRLIPFYGGTYFPHAQFLSLITSIAKTIQTKGGDIEQLSVRLDEMLKSKPAIDGKGILTLAHIQDNGTDLMSQVDQEWGGFGETMKFPMPTRLHFLLHLYRKTGDKKTAGMIALTLDKMASGGIYDQIGGGFHRYAVERTWLIPHFEKMLYDNAQLASLYLESSAVFDNAGYANIARQTLDFVLRDFYRPGGGFYSSFDADSEGVEGRYYLWQYDDFIAATGKAEGPLMASIMGVTPNGNFENVNILTRRNPPEIDAANFGIGNDELRNIYDRNILKLLSSRQNRIRPQLDKKIIMGWNGLAISAMARAFLLFGDDRYLGAARNSVDYIWSYHRLSSGAFLRSSYDEKAANPAILEDYAFLANGLIDLFESTADTLYLERAIELIEYTRINFPNPDGGFYMSASNHDNPYSRRIELWDHVTPSGNAAMLTALFRLGRLISNENYVLDAQRALTAYSEIMRQVGREMPAWHDLALFYYGPFYQIVIAGDSGAPSTKSMLDIYQRWLPAYCQMIRIPHEGITESAQKILPVAMSKNAPKGQAMAYVCSYGNCKSPTSDSETFGRQIRDGWAI